MVIGFTPVGAYYAGKEFEEAWLDFGASDKKDVKRVTTATLNLMLLGIGTKKAMAEYRASKEILTHADELERSGKVDEAKAYRETAAYKKADATDKLLNLNRQMKDTHQSISNYIQERNDKLTTWSRTTKGKFSADSLKPAQNVIRESDLPAKTKVTVKDPLVIDDLIENSFTNDSFFYEVADKEFYVSDWDIVKVEKPKKFDSMSEQASKEMQDYLRVIKVKTKDTRAGFEDQYIEKDILLIIEDKMLVSKENADAVSSLELPSNLANGAEKLFTYDSVFGNTPDLIVIHMSKDLMNKPEAFSYALSRQMAELTAIKDALIKHEEGLPEAQMKKVIKEAEESITFDMTNPEWVDQMYELAKDNAESEVAQQFMKLIDEQACFPAGTRITTDKGLKRIEDIQVGDMVLSKHESGIGEQEFKPVVRTVVHHNKPIFELTYAVVKNTTKENSLSDKAILKLSQKGNVSVIRATPNHPFWVKGQGWIGLDKLKKGQLLEMKDDDTVAYVICVSPQYQTNFSNIGASYGFENEINFYDQTISELEPQYHLQRYDDKGDRIFLRTKEICGKNLTVEGVGNIQVSDKIKLDTVYNFEVADNHTYYIFDEMWVHNACPKFTFEDVKSYNKNVPVPKSHSEISKQFMRAVTEDGACFPAGTLVHTDKGLVPIQDIKVGDMVLSRPEWGGRDAPTEYKRVVRAFCSGEEEVVRVSCQKNSEYGDPDALRYFEFMTPNHPIWDETLNDWIPASNIEIGTLLSSIENEDNLRVLEVDIVWDSYTKGIGITYPIYSDESEVDFMVAFNNQGYKVHSDKFISDYYISDAQDIKLNLEYSKEVFKNYENKSWAGNRKPIKVPVYNLEVESFHTYFVGEQAIWVHNDNCFYEYLPNLVRDHSPLPNNM